MSKKLLPKKPTRLAGLLESLRNSGLRITEPRIGVLEALLNGHGPFTTEEIYSFVHEKNGCDLATIYRSLASLETAHLIKRCEFGDGTARYELSSLEKHHHHHLICRKCKKVEVLDDCELQEIDRFARKKGFSNVTHSLEFFGLCPDCTITS
jgi:Fur family transcriptional regulator, ferric uptake regulator